MLLILIVKVSLGCDVLAGKAPITSKLTIWFCVYICPVTPLGNAVLVAVNPKAGCNTSKRIGVMVSLTHTVWLANNGSLGVMVGVG